MKTGTPLHSEVNHQINFDNLLLSLDGVDVTLDNLVNIRTTSNCNYIVIAWLITVSLKDNKALVMDYAFETTINIVSVVDYDTDLKDVKLLVGSSCTEFMELIEKMTGLMPSIQPKFEEIAIRLLEVMTDKGIY